MLTVLFVTDVVGEGADSVFVLVKVEVLPGSVRVSVSVLVVAVVFPGCALEVSRDVVAVFVSAASVAVVVSAAAVAVFVPAALVVMSLSLPSAWLAALEAMLCACCATVPGH